MEAFQGKQDVLGSGCRCTAVLRGEMLVVFFDEMPHRACQFEPFVEVGHRLGIGHSREKGCHGAALGVAANDDIADAKGVDGEFNGRGSAVRPGGGFGRRDDIAHIFDDKEVARLTLSDQFGQDPRVGTGDEQGVGILPFPGETVEKLLVAAQLFIPELMDPFDQFLQGLPLSS